MYRLSVSLVLLILFLIPVSEASAQTGSFTARNITGVNNPVGAVDIYVEASTYTPNFYRGRAEPSSGNVVKLIAMPAGLDGTSSEVTYRWSVNGQNLSDTDQTASFTAPIGNNFTAKVLVMFDGQLWAERSEVISLSEPTIYFYEDNALRGIGAVAIGENFTLIGEEASISAEPFFVGEGSLSMLRGTWKVDGEAVRVDDWRKLSFTRPEEPKNRYLVALELINPNNFAESMENSFYLQLGL